MIDKNIYTALGLMSGTSMDGIDASIIKTDGKDFIEVIGSTCVPMDPDIKFKLQEVIGSDKFSPQSVQELIKQTSKELNAAHIDAIKEVCASCEISLDDLDLIGLHGQTITHRPEQKFTWQIGGQINDAAEIGDTLGCNVICNFRENDVHNGGQGAPLIPVYHKAKLLASEAQLPSCVINIGGVSNLTIVNSVDDNDLIAFDTGPGNALIDDFVFARTNKAMDKNGERAKNGQINQDYLQKWLSNPYFSKLPPKSLDRNHFKLEQDLRLMSDEDGAATLTAFTCFAIAKGIDILIKKQKISKPIKSFYVSGGGRHNPLIMSRLNDLLGNSVKPVEDLGWQGDFIESEGFAYLAVRSLLGLPISFEKTTGAKKALTGGELYKPNT